jgi:hypothetical protein
MRQLRSLALTALVGFAVLVPVHAQASTARVEGTGLQSDYLQDYVNVILYPSSIVRYPNLVYGDFGVKNVDGGDLTDFQDNNANPALDNAGRGMGAHVTGDWLPGVWGVQINENHIPLSAAYGAPYYNRNMNEGLTLLWGQKFGGISLGAMYARSSSSFEQGTTDLQPFPWTAPGALPAGANARQIMNGINAALGASPRNTDAFSAGVSFDWNAFGRRHSADVSAQYRTLSLHQEAVIAGNAQVLEDDGGMALSFNARAQMAMSDDSYLVPVFNYYTMDFSTEFTDAATPGVVTSFENTVTGLNFGLAKGWVMRESDLLMLGLALQNQSIEWADPSAFGAAAEVTYSQTPAIFGALEVRPTGWLQLRFGAGSPIFNKLEVTDTASGVETVFKDSEIQYALGLGFRIGGRLDLDAVLNQDFAFTGGWAASGLSEAPLSRLSATYRF